MKYFVIVIFLFPLYGVCIEDSANLSSSDLVTLAESYEARAETKKNREKAIGFYKMAAEMGNAKAALRLARIYKNNIQWRSPSQSIRYFNMAVDLGSMEATLNLAGFYEKGDMVKQSIHRAFDLYKLASSQGSARAAFKVAEIYEDSYTEFSANYDPKQLLLYYIEAAKKGSVKAMAELAHIFSSGGEISNAADFLDTDEVEILALRYLKQAAEAGHTESQLTLADNYLHGVGGVRQDKASALKYYETAGKAGSIEALEKLGYIHFTLFTDIRQSIHYYIEALKKGSRKADRMLNTTMLKLLTQEEKKEILEAKKQNPSPPCRKKF